MESRGTVQRPELEGLELCESILLAERALVQERDWLCPLLASRHSGPVRHDSSTLHRSSFDPQNLYGFEPVLATTLTSLGFD